MKQVVLGFGLLTLAVLILFRLSEFAYFRGYFSLEMLLLSISGIVFLLVGAALGRRYFNSTSTTVTGENIFTLDEKAIINLGISKREYEVLQQVAEGMSNNEIAEKLFLSETTVKTHVSNLLVKLSARRRTQAVKIAKELKLIP